VKVLYFGTYERAYPRNAQVISCLRRADVDVVERHVSVWDAQEHKFAAGPAAALRLARAELELLRRPRGEFDALIVGYPGQFDVAAAKRAARGRPLVLNPLVSLWDTFVGDRRRFGARSLAGRGLRAVDRAAFRTADVVAADTAEHARLFQSLGARRAAVIFVGAEERLFTPRDRAPDDFHVLFYGKFSPLHGIETVVAAATLLPDVRFRIVGEGQLELGALPANVVHVPWVPYEELPRELHVSGCALGIFGTTAKSQRVIPNKVLQALACGVPVITADTPAARELLDDDSAVLVPAGDATALAAAIRTVQDDGARLAAAGRAVYEQRASEEVLGAQWRGLVESLL
jgi:glycosyltransferase involved in cell wall biosynthesis